MATIKVVSPFTVQLDPVPPPDPSEAAPKATAGTRDANAPTKYVFPVAGTYEDVPEEVATHPYTLPHLEGYEAPPEVADEMTASTVVMVPLPEEPATAEEAEAVLTDEQRNAIARRRAAEAAAAARPVQE
jgi:hypothetical protein